MASDPGPKRRILRKRLACVVPPDVPEAAEHEKAEPRVMNHDGAVLPDDIQKMIEAAYT